MIFFIQDLAIRARNFKVENFELNIFKYEKLEIKVKKFEG